jgi:hypothetical protein
MNHGGNGNNNNNNNGITAPFGSDRFVSPLIITSQHNGSSRHPLSSHSRSISGGSSHGSDDDNRSNVTDETSPILSHRGLSSDVSGATSGIPSPIPSGGASTVSSTSPSPGGSWVSVDNSGHATVATVDADRLPIVPLSRTDITATPSPVLGASATTADNIRALLERSGISVVSTAASGMIGGHQYHHQRHALTSSMSDDADSGTDTEAATITAANTAPASSSTSSSASLASVASPSLPTSASMLSIITDDDRRRLGMLLGIPSSGDLAGTGAATTATTTGVLASPMAQLSFAPSPSPSLVSLSGLSTAPSMSALGMLMAGGSTLGGGHGHAHSSPASSFASLGHRGVQMTATSNGGSVYMSSITPSTPPLHPHHSHQSSSSSSHMAPSYISLSEASAPMLDYEPTTPLPVRSRSSSSSRDHRSSHQTPSSSSISNNNNGYSRTSLIFAVLCGALIGGCATAWVLKRRAAVVAAALPPSRWVPSLLSSLTSSSSSLPSLSSLSSTAATSSLIASILSPVGLLSNSATTSTLAGASLLDKPLSSSSLEQARAIAAAVASVTGEAAMVPWTAILQQLGEVQRTLSYHDQQINVMRSLLLRFDPAIRAAVMHITDR